MEKIAAAKTPNQLIQMKLLKQEHDLALIRYNQNQEELERLKKKRRRTSSVVVLPSHSTEPRKKAKIVPVSDTESFSSSSSSESEEEMVEEEVLYDEELNAILKDFDDGKSLLPQEKKSTAAPVIEEKKKRKNRNKKKKLPKITRTITNSPKKSRYEWTQSNNERAREYDNWRSASYENNNGGDGGGRRMDQMDRLAAFHENWKNGDRPPPSRRHSRGDRRR